MKESENMKLPKNYKEAKKRGWTVTDTSLERGYVSVKDNPNDAPLMYAGDRGKRAGQFYILLHNPNSSQYAIRQYLKPPR
ncbi:MAG: hypothetical protein Q4P17_03975 [Methanobacterium sp.]|nr:hypothetical protein [Methanobacterium sp.]